MTEKGIGGGSWPSRCGRKPPRSRSTRRGPTRKGLRSGSWIGPAEEPRSARHSRGSAKSSATRSHTKSWPPSRGGGSRWEASIPGAGPFCWRSRSSGTAKRWSRSSTPGFLDGAQWDEEFRRDRLELVERPRSAQALSRELLRTSEDLASRDATRGLRVFESPSVLRHDQGSIAG